MNGEFSSEMLSGNTVVIHPGSLYLRIGRGCDPNPTTILHAIARKRLVGGKYYKDSHLVPRKTLNSKESRMFESSHLQVKEALNQVIRRDGSKRMPPSDGTIEEFNCTSEVAKCDTTNRVSSQCFDDVVVGDEVLDIPDNFPYNIHYPFRRGDLNIHRDAGGSLSSILVDIHEIWSRSIETHLGLSPVDLKHYKAVLVIPALHKRNMVKHYINLLLINLGFGGCFVIQDHVAATFGSGLASACVVDIGDQKTSISCVDDGVSQSNTRICIGYGGSDISQLLYYLGERNKIWKLSSEFSKENEWIHEVKEKNCHLLVEKSAIQSHDITRDNNKVTVHLGDEVLVAPLGFFHTDLLEVTGRKMVTVMGKDVGDSEDPHDHLYLRETSRKYTKIGDIHQQHEDTEFEENDLDIVSSPDVGNGELPLALDQAILKSIEMCSSDDLKKKMLSNILIVGGGFRFSGSAEYLQKAINQSLINCQCEVVMDPKDGTSDHTVWKGAAIMSGKKNS